MLVRQLQSISNPPSLGQEVAPASIRTPGSSGEWPDEPSRSTRYLVGKGRSDPLELFHTVGPYESVIGRDERQRVLDTDLTPWRKICSLQMRGALGSGVIGTGWLVGPRTVITAGHCVFSH